MEESLFDRYGGFTTVSRIVSEFYNRMMDEPLVTPYFTGVDMPALIDHQTKFIASVMGGPASFSNERLARAHARLGIDEKSFDRVVSILQETLEDFDLDKTDVGTIMSQVTSKKGLIVTR